MRQLDSFKQQLNSSRWEDSWTASSSSYMTRISSRWEDSHVAAALDKLKQQLTVEREFDSCHGCHLRGAPVQRSMLRQLDSLKQQLHFVQVDIRNSSNIGTCCRVMVLGGCCYGGTCSVLHDKWSITLLCIP
jgi:hypothetical protein